MADRCADGNNNGLGSGNGLSLPELKEGEEKNRRVDGLAAERGEFEARQAISDNVSSTAR